MWKEVEKTLLLYSIRTQGMEDSTDRSDSLYCSSCVVSKQQSTGPFVCVHQRGGGRQHKCRDDPKQSAFLKNKKTKQKTDKQMYKSLLVPSGFKAQPNKNVCKYTPDHEPKSSWKIVTKIATVALEKDGHVVLVCEVATGGALPLSSTSSPSIPTIYALQREV